MAKIKRGTQVHKVTLDSDGTLRRGTTRVQYERSTPSGVHIVKDSEGLEYHCDRIRLSETPVQVYSTQYKVSSQNVDESWLIGSTYVSV